MFAQEIFAVTLLRAFNFESQSVGLFSPSGSVGNFPRRLDRGLAALNAAVAAGYQLSTSALDVAGSENDAPAKRAADFNALVADPNIGLIMSTTGGYQSNRMLPFIDVEAFRRNPKAVVGFSDTTSLLLYLYRQTGATCFHGPALMPSLGEPGFATDNMQPLLSMLAGEDPGNLISPPSRANRSFRFWDRDDDLPDFEATPEQLACLYDGAAEGVLIGGNLDTLIVAMASSFAPDFKGAILFWEAAFGSADKLRRDLHILEAAGVFDVVSAMIVGAGFHVANADEPLIQALASDVAKRHRLPTIAGAYIGHCQPIRTLPIGARVKFRSEDLSVKLLEPIK